MKYKKFLNNWLFKAVMTTILPFIIGLICNEITWKDNKGGYINTITFGKFVFIILIVIYVVYVWYIAYNDKKQEDLKKQINTLRMTINEKDKIINIFRDENKSLNYLMDISQKEINELAKKISSNSNLDLLSWNFQSISNYICKDIVNIISKLSKYGNDISVNVYTRHKDDNKKRKTDYIKMIAHYGGANSTPSILGTNIILNKKKNWQYAKLFLENNPKFVVYTTEKEIKENFEYNGNPDKYNGEYSQYVGIPISCSSGNILCALEIVAHNGTIIAETKEELLDIINNYISIYRNYELLTIKIEKGLKSKRIDVNM